MNTWLIDLDGGELDIAELKQIVSAFNCTIVADLAGKPRLSGASFEALSDQAEVRQLATKLLSLLNGVARLAHSNHIPVQVGSGVTRVSESGARHVSVLMSSGEMRLRGSPVTLIIKRADGTTEVDAETTRNAKRLAYLAKDEPLAGVLDAISGPLSWQRLRVALERLAAIVGGGGNAFVKQRYATTAEIERLKSNMQHPDHSGIDAVHGVPVGRLKGEKMTEQEGLELIARLLNSHIDSQVAS